MCFAAIGVNKITIKWYGRWDDMLFLWKICNNCILMLVNRVQATCSPSYSEKENFLLLIENCGEMHWTMCLAGGGSI